MRKNFISRATCLAMAALLLNLQVYATTPLKRGTAVPIKLTSEVSSRNSSAPTATVVADVKNKDGVILIKAGTPVAVSYKNKKAGAIGKPGVITMSFSSTTAIDGSMIALDGSTIELEGESKRGLSLGLSIGLTVGTIVGLPFLAFLALKGKDATIPAGTTYSNYTVSFDVDIEN